MLSESDFPELRVERELDSTTGVTRARYFWNGVEVRKVMLAGNVAERHAGLALINKDLANALRWVQKAAALLAEFAESTGSGYRHLKDRDAGDQAKALFVAALTFYGKAFTEAPGRRAMLSRDSLDSEFRDAHDYFMRYRHNLAAHSGDEKLEVAESYLLLIPEKRNFQIRLGSNRLQPDFDMGGVEEIGFESLIEHAIKKVSDQYERAGRRIVEAAARHDRQFWVRVPKREPFNIDKLIKEMDQGSRK